MHRIYLFGVSGLALALCATACNDSDATSGGHAGSPASVGTPASAGASGSAETDAGAGGTAGAAGQSALGGEAGQAGEAGEAGQGGDAGAPSAVSRCEAGGTLFVAGNYGDAKRSLLLRTTATAATLALLPKGAASSANLPQLFLVERSCAPGGALIARDESTHYRVDFDQSENRLSICFLPAATLQAALELEPADKAHAADRGCAGKPFQSFVQEAL